MSVKTGTELRREAEAFIVWAGEDSWGAQVVRDLLDEWTAAATPTPDAPQGAGSEDER